MMEYKYVCYGNEFHNRVEVRTKDLLAILVQMLECGEDYCQLLMIDDLKVNVSTIYLG